MKTHIPFFLLSGLASATFAQTPAPDANTLLNLGRFDEATVLLRRQAQQQPSTQTYFDAGYGYLRAGKPDSARFWFEKGMPLDEKRVPLNETGFAITYLVKNDLTNAEPKLTEVVDKSKGKNADILY